MDQGATATDNFDDDEELTANIMVTGLPLDTSMTGVFTILYEVVDTAGNVAEPKSRVVQVIDDAEICAEASKLFFLSLSLFLSFSLSLSRYIYWILQKRQVV